MPDRPRSLVTGAAGFVGANLVRRLLADGHEVVATTRSQPAAWRLAAVRGDAHVLELDLRDGAAVERAVAAVRPEWVFHLAAHGAYSWETDVREIVATNVVGTVNLLQAALRGGARAFVHTGSSSEYGFKDHAPREDEALEPNSTYAAAKASATLLCRQLAARDWAHVVTLRLYSVYGAWEEPGRLVPKLVVHALGGRLPPLVDPEIARDFVHVDDVCDALATAAARPTGEPGAVFNVGSGRQTTLRELVDLARRAFDVGEEPEWGTMDARSWDTRSWLADPSKIHEQLGWAPRVGLEDGLRAMADWLRAERGQYDRYGLVP